jgi:hypothetical protein
MNSVAVRDVKQLPSADKRSLENLVGRPLEDDQQVLILAFKPGVVPTHKAREEALAGLVQTWEKVERHMQQHVSTEEAFDAAVEEAIATVRRGQD